MKLAIGIPAYGGLALETSFALMDLAAHLTSIGLAYARIAHQECADIAFVRNAIFHHFLAGNADRLLLVDADSAFDATLVLERLVLSEFDYVGANYPRKRHGGGWASTPRAEGARIGPLVEAEMLATGLLALSRTAVERLTEGAPLFVFEGQLMRAAMQTGPMNGVWVGEDEWLCRRWQALGEVAWIDTSVRCDHVGSFKFSRETT